MSRWIALLVAFCAAGLAVADARCVVSCATAECVPRPKCHHQPPKPAHSCIEQHSSNQALTQTISWTDVPSQSATLVPSALTPSIVGLKSQFGAFFTHAQQPPGPSPTAALRI